MCQLRTKGSSATTTWQARPFFVVLVSLRVRQNMHPNNNKSSPSSRQGLVWCYRLCTAAVLLCWYRSKIDITLLYVSTGTMVTRTFFEGLAWRVKHVRPYVRTYLHTRQDREEPLVLPSWGKDQQPTSSGSKVFFLYVTRGRAGSILLLMLHYCCWSTIGRAYEQKQQL